MLLLSQPTLARLRQVITKSGSNTPNSPRWLDLHVPELYTAFERDDSNFPVQYIGANVPQAWAAGSSFMLTQAMLGFLPDAPRNKLYVDPSLPRW